ncbi:MAG: inorganic diphosphatase [Rhodospirillaceae bacterium]|nr:inorganic diphosphatase [Rhodospirillaceae bacterium]
MDINLIPVGEAPPWDVNVIIENPLGGSPVKYEIDKTSRAIFVDRFLHTAMFYPGNYGFIPHTLAGDGDPMDVLVVGQVPVIAGAVLRSRPVGMMRMEDEAGEDEKILAVPVDKLHPYFSSVTNYEQLPETLLEQIAHFFSHYKDLEKEKWVKVQGWEDADAAAKAITKSIDRGRKAAGR